MAKRSLKQDVQWLKKESAPLLASESPDPARATFLLGISLSLVEVMALRLFKNSSNSGTPPGSDPGRRNDRNRGSSGKGPWKGERVGNPDTTKTRRTLSPSECAECGAGLEDGAVVGRESRTVFDIVYECTEEELTAETRRCGCCGFDTKAPFPKGVDGPVQYGDGVKSAIVESSAVHMTSLQRIQEHLAGITGRLISHGAMLKCISKFSESLKGWAEGKRERLRDAPAVHADETSLSVGGKKWWMHTCGYGDLVLHSCHPSRGMEAIREMGVLTGYRGAIVHDCLSMYFMLKEARHALCIAHLLRDLKLIEDSTGDGWATGLKRLLAKTVEQVGSREAGVLDENEYARLERGFERVLVVGLLELPGAPERTGRRGKPTHTFAQNVWTRCLKRKDDFLRFAREEAVPPTNNLAERNIRMTKVKMKVSGCFRSPGMAAHFCRIRGYLQTMRNRGYSHQEAIALALKGDIPDRGG